LGAGHEPTGRPAGLGGGADAMSVDGMIVAASTTLLADSRAGKSGGGMPWVLLAVGSVASLAANVAVAQPTASARTIAAWPSFALIAAYELLMRQVRQGAAASGKVRAARPGPRIHRREGLDGNVHRPRRRLSESAAPGEASGGRDGASGDLRWQAWQWALANRAGDGSPPSGREIACPTAAIERRGSGRRGGAAGQGKRRLGCSFRAGTAR
jgi:Protein of unknown function (DUF2637)